MASLSLRLKKIFILFCWTLVLFSALVCPVRAAFDIVVLQSSLLTPYENARLAFLRAIARIGSLEGRKGTMFAEISEFVLSEEKDVNRLRDKLAVRNPDLFLAIGTRGLAEAQKYGAVPIVFLMVPNAEALIADHLNIAGVSMSVSPEQQLKGLVSVMPQVKRVGMLYDPANSAELAARAVKVAQAMDLSLIIRPTSSAKQVHQQLHDISKSIDIFWMVPDPTVVTAQTVESMFLLSLEHGIPILTFSDKYLRKGAMVSVSYDIQAMGAKAGEMAEQILTKVSRAADLSVRSADDYQVRVNHNVAARLGVTIKTNAAETQVGE